MFLCTTTYSYFLLQCFPRVQEVLFQLFLLVHTVSMCHILRGRECIIYNNHCACLSFKQFSLSNVLVINPFTCLRCGNAQTLIVSVLLCLFNFDLIINFNLRKYCALKFFCFFSSIDLSIS